MGKKKGHHLGESDAVKRQVTRRRPLIGIGEIAGIVVLVVLAAGGLAWLNARGAEQQGAAPTTVAATAAPGATAAPTKFVVLTPHIDPLPGEKVKGNPEAKVTVMEFSDFQ